MKEKILLSFVCFFVWQASSHAKTTYIPTGISGQVFE